MKEFLFAYLQHRDPDGPTSWWCKPSGLGVSVDRLNQIAALVYFLAAISPLIYVVAVGESVTALSPLHQTSWGARLLALGLWVLGTFLPTMWMWVHASAFFLWVQARHAKNRAAKAVEMEWFKQHAEFAKALWASLLALYGASFLSAGNALLNTGGH